MNGAGCDAVNGSPASQLNAASAGDAVFEVNGSVHAVGDGYCYTPVTDPDSVALLAAMCEANRSLTATGSCMLHYVQMDHLH